MKCDNCLHLQRDGYEYPEWFCEIFVGDNEKCFKYDGCTLNKIQRAARCRKAKEHDCYLQWDEDEELKKGIKAKEG